MPKAAAGRQLCASWRGSDSGDKDDLRRRGEVRDAPRRRCGCKAGDPAAATSPKCMRDQLICAAVQPPCRHWRPRPSQPRTSTMADRSGKVAMDSSHDSGRPHCNCARSWHCSRQLEANPCAILAHTARCKSFVRAHTRSCRALRPAHARRCSREVVRKLLISSAQHGHAHCTASCMRHWCARAQARFHTPVDWRSGLTRWI